MHLPHIQLYLFFSSFYLFTITWFFYCTRIVVYHKMSTTIIIKLCLIICLFLTFYCPLTEGWLRPRRLNVLSRSLHRYHDDRCRQFKTFIQKVDHFGFNNLDTFQQRYILNTDYWQNGRPIFFYAGNEG